MYFKTLFRSVDLGFRAMVIESNRFKKIDPSKSGIKKKPDTVWKNGSMVVCRNRWSAVRRRGVKNIEQHYI